jgi:hypothetical protein
MAYIAEYPSTSGVQFQPILRVYNGNSTNIAISPNTVSSGGGGGSGPSIPTEGLIWWPRK